MDNDERKIAGIIRKKMQEACDRLLMQQNEMYDAMCVKGYLDDVTRNAFMVETSSCFIFEITKEKIFGKKPHVLTPAVIKGEIVDHGVHQKV